MTKEEFKKDIFDAMEEAPYGWRKGQFVFNYIDMKYNVARYIQFKCGIDCFYNDDEIDNFIDKAYELIEKK